MKPQITLPNRNGAEEIETLQCDNNLVIIGANGSGKTRLGAWIERTLDDRTIVHRLSAQRALSIPHLAQMKQLEQAEKGLRFGNDGGSSNQKMNHRWRHHPETTMLNDYEQLLSLLFARSAKRDADYTEESKNTVIYREVPKAPLDIIEGIWKDIMPQRIISFKEGKVLVREEGKDEYHGSEMSDGERVTLYLIGQCLTAPNNSIIIIDEPELHLHKSLMSRIWNKVEELCPDKLLVYITHDLDFAASRKGAEKIWIKSYGGHNDWKWDEVPEVNEIPENLVIEIIGNRKKIIFTEGEKSSYDTALYQSVYSDYHIIPRGGCEKVIESTKASRATPSLHHFSAFGIVDIDYRTTVETDALKESGIFTIDVAEVENLFCIEPIIRIISENQHMDPDLVVKEVTDFIFKTLSEELEIQITNRVEQEIQFKLNSYTKNDHTEKGLNDGFAKLLAEIDIAKLYIESRKLYTDAIASGKLEEALKLYNRKSLHKRIAPIFGLAGNDYINLVLRMLKSSKKNEIIAALKSYTPVLT